MLFVLHPVFLLSTGLSLSLCLIYDLSISLALFYCLYLVYIILFHSCTCLALFFNYITSGNRTPGSRFYSDLLDASVCMHQLILKRRSRR